MAIRLRKSIKIMPGVRLNLSKSGVSTTIGKRGASVTVGQRGTRTNVGIPGSGISYSTTNAPSTQQQQPAPAKRPRTTWLQAIMWIMLFFLITEVARFFWLPSS